MNGLEQTSHTTMSPVVDIETKHVLIVDDEKSAREGLSELVSSWGFAPLTAKDGQEALELIERYQPYLIICDLIMPNMDGLKLLKETKKRCDAVVIILTAQGTIDSAVEAIKHGAYDYLTKPIDMIRLKNLIQRVREKAEIVSEVKRLRRELRELGKFGALIGKSQPMKELFHSIETIAPSSASVLINGESGTGKELVARAIHDMSPRKNKPFIAINCSAIPSTLLESEIFGYEKGAFTGASRTKEGNYELAHLGTLFLDEIVEMAPDLQIKLLRVLEDGSFRRIGGKQELKADVRIVAASNINFQEAMDKGKLREDLFYRLNVFCLDLPPLRERKEDIPLLTQFFVNEYGRQNNKPVSGTEVETLACLQAYSWPGNVRELRNIIERAVIVAKQELLTLEDIPGHLSKKFEGRRSKQNRLPITIQIGDSLEKLENQIVQKTLELTRGNKTQAAKLLGITPKTLHNKINKL